VLFIMTLSLGGLASGIDTNALVDGLMAVAKQPSDQLAARKTQVDAASTTISTFSSKLAALKTAALALTTNVGFASSTATSSDASVVATTTGSVSTGSYSVTVGQLARGQKTRSTTSGSSSTALGMSGSLDIQVGSDVANLKNVPIVATDTLADIASKISSSGARISASVMNDGTGYRLIVQGLDTGAANAFTIAENGTTLGFGAAGSPTPGSTYETALDASFTVDGMQATSPTNQVTGVVGGLKLALTKLTTTPTIVQVGTDSTVLRQKVTSLMNSYNDVINYGHQQAGFGGSKASNPVLAADSAIRGALHKMGGLLTAPIPGTTGAYTTMRSIGLKAGQDGTLTMDYTKLDDALAADPDSVRRLFVTDASTGATGLMDTLMKGVDSLVSGTGGAVAARISALQAQSKRIDDAKTKMDLRLTDYQAQLKKQFSAMDAAVGKYKAMQTSLDSSILSNSSMNGTSG
jgi:flagellar hook-associated protein 2